MKKSLAAKKFMSSAEVIADVNAYLEGLGKLYYTEGVKRILEYHWYKCTEF